MRKIYYLLPVIFIVQNLKAQNADFEAASITNPTPPSTITVVSSAAISGWTVNGGSNSAWGSTGNCTNTTAITGNPNACVLISPGASGHIDPIIGSVYPIYSVFGPTTTTYPGATTANGFQCYGDWFIKLNNQTPGSSVNRISKIISVTPANALFQFAFMNVIEGSHCCCDNGGFSLKLKVGCGVPTLTTCPSFSSASNAGTGCTPTGSCNSAGNNTSYSVSAINANWNYSKWKKHTLDLSPFIGTCVTIEITAFDCPYSGHAGYTFFDAQSSPLEVIVNGNIYEAGTPMMTVSHCGAGSTATITAPLVAGSYTWTAPGSFTVAPGSGGQTIYTSIAGSYTLAMNPPGACSPIIRIVNLIMSPAPNMAVPSSTMFSCSNPFTNGVSVIMSSGTATNNPSIPNYTVSFSPAQPTGTIGVSANTGTYTGLVVGINTITITDSVGCKATQTINITPMPSIPSFAINAPNGTVVGCVPPTVPLDAMNTSTLSGMTYTWTSATQPTSVTGTYNAFGNTTYTISGSAPGSCISTITFAVTQSTAVPSMTVSPITQSLTCNGGCKTFTAVTSTTTNIVGNWYGPGGSNIIGPSTTPLIMCANAAGSYTAQFCNTINGCCTSQTVSVSSNSAIPTLSVTSVSGGFTLSCTKPCLPMFCPSSGTLAPTTYTWTNLTTSVSTMPFNGGFTVCITGANGPGSYEAAFMDGNFCKVTTTINVTIDTLRPSPISMTNLTSNSYTLNCFTPSLVATAITNPMLPASSYSWTQPPSFIINSNTINIGTGNIPGPSGSSVTYTVSAMGANGCVGRAKVNFYKDTYVPPYGAAFTPSAITCANPCIAMTATTTTTVNVTYTFTSPPPTQTATTAGALFCTAGTYTMNYMNVNNGCTNSVTTSVPLNVTPPATFALAPQYLLCGATTTIINAGHTGSASAGTYSYSWDGPPSAGMSCPGGVSCYSSSVNYPGTYNVYILNLTNGCSSTNSVSVIQTSSVPISISTNTMICVGEIAILTASGASSYTWSTGSNANPIGVSPTVTTTYTVLGSIGGPSVTCSGQQSITITVDPCIGIEELTWSKNISIAPNPNTGKFTVVINANIENAEIKIVNAIGQEVFKQNIKQGRNEINVGVLAKGIYHYIITQNKEPVNRGKILIE